MAVQSSRTLYPFAKVVRVASEGTTGIDVWEIPAGTIITMVLVRIVTAAVDAGGSNLTVGDDDTANGFILAADVTAAADTIYGDDPTERGAYLYDGTKKGSFVKYYPDEGKEIKFDCSAAIDTEGVFDVYIYGFRASE